MEFTGNFFPKDGENSNLDYIVSCPENCEQGFNDQKMFPKIISFEFNSSTNKEPEVKEAIPTGKTIPRTPATSDKISEKIQNKPKSPDQQKEIQNIDDIVIKPSKSVQGPANYDKPKENYIPSGCRNLPRTPYVQSSKNDTIAENVENESIGTTELKKKTTKHQDELPKEIINNEKKNSIPNIPKGRTIPRTPAIPDKTYENITEENSNSETGQFSKI